MSTPRTRPRSRADAEARRRRQSPDRSSSAPHPYGSRSPGDAVRRAKGLIEQFDTNAIVSPIEIEFLAGILDAHEMSLAGAFLNCFRIIDERRVIPQDWLETRRIAKHVGRDSGRRDLGDCLIAAIADRLPHDVLTKDRRFARHIGRTRPGKPERTQTRPTPVRPDSQASRQPSLRGHSMKIGMNLLLWTTEVTAEHDALLGQLKAIGFDGVEVPIFEVGDRAPYERLGKRLGDLGLGATGVTVMGPESNPISPDPAIRKAAVAHLEKVLDRASAFGCEILAGPTHSAIGVFSGAGPTADEFQHGVDTLRQVAEKAEGFGVKVAVEYLNRFENYFLTTAADTARFVRAVDHPSLKMMYDSFHAHIEEKDQARAIASCAAETIHIHVSENDRGIPGTGQVDWDGYWSAIKSTGFDGYLTIEAFGNALPAIAAATKVWRPLFPDSMGLCREGLDFIKRSTGMQH